MSMPRLLSLTETEIATLVRAVTEGKVSVLEDDVMALCRWAEEVRTQQAILEMILAGDVLPLVEEGQVRVALPATQRPRRRNAS